MRVPVLLQRVACVNAVWRSCESALDKCRVRAGAHVCGKTHNVFFHGAVRSAR